MDRAVFEGMTVEDLKEAARKAHLPVAEDKETLVSALTAQAERTRFNPNLEATIKTWAHKSASTDNLGPASTGTVPKGPRRPSQSEQISPEMTALVAAITAPMQQLQQQILQAQKAQNLLDAADAVGGREGATHSYNDPGVRNVGAGGSGPPSPRSGTQSPQTTLSSVSSSHAVSMLSSQIPEYGGLEDENVQLWIKRVEQVSSIHRVIGDVTLLAASSKLTKTAKRWYDQGSGSMLESWDGFRTAILKRFSRKVLYHVALQKIEARKWTYSKETFLEYAMDKINLMHGLDLSTDSMIHLLISGISGRSMRETAAALSCTSVDEFLDLMHQITSISAEPDRRHQAEQKEKKEGAGRSSGKAPASGKQPRTDLVCNYCSKKGHLRADCYKLKRKEQGSSPAASAAASSTAAAVTESASSTAAAVTESATPAAASASAVSPEVSTPPTAASTVAAIIAEDQTVACGQPDGRTLKIKNVPLVIEQLNSHSCRLTALVDTGSPISFVKPSVVDSYLVEFRKILRKPLLTYKALNNQSVDLEGSLQTTVKFHDVPHPFPITLHVLKNDELVTDVIVGRDFLDSQGITAIYCPTAKPADGNEQLFSRSLLQILACDVFDSSKGDTHGEKSIAEIHTDFGPETDRKVRDLLLNAEKKKIDKVQEDYSVRIHLKDESIYAYAPRRIAFAERKQLREITDGLLARGIIKESNSPYCARVVPVRKKNGMIRLCVDLRPLNSRVVKQKYPFPLIEDCIANLSNKSVFTLLDLKDGFHQIKVHAEDTKYFAFATPDGQFEYTCLPFGFCDSPAEFQKRIASILSPLIRADKVIVYMDDIMIATETVEANLKVLNEVISILRRYDFKLNIDVTF
ncbi:PREDICTED: uncharacterized protein LOC105556816 [Vollenhovia emeryi]|uniref:uncharacterized protein LOC105556816 n=1 Tax=Vollenhovia emeryi TaxID=411798 RepID=UPI0005F407C7|nr:PREDICTED: uncharacterized protein LOC105556816 [Vollenhovia emeryi]